MFDPSPHPILRVAARFEENKMSANNLGIVFGPTLLRPPDVLRAPSASPVACLLDSGHQAQLVEYLIVNYEQIFGMDELALASESLTRDVGLSPALLESSPQHPALLHVQDTQSLTIASDSSPDPRHHSTLEKYPEVTAPEVSACLFHRCGRALSVFNSPSFGQLGIEFRAWCVLGV